MYNKLCNIYYKKTKKYKYIDTPLFSGNCLLFGNITEPVGWHVVLIKCQYPLYISYLAELSHNFKSIQFVSQ